MRILKIALSICAFFTISCESEQQTQSKIENEKTLTELGIQIRELKASNKNAPKKRIFTKLENAKKDYATLSAQLEPLEQKANMLDESIATAEAEITKLNSQL